MTSIMTHTTMEQTLPKGWSKRLIITLTAYVITLVWEAGTRFILSLLTVVEVVKTTFTYCPDGRVRVTFIMDSVLVVMFTEVISRWFTSGDWDQFAVLGGCYSRWVSCASWPFVQSGDVDGHATGQSNGVLIPIISPGVAYAYEFFS
jgi:hypothetical protein